MADPRGFLRHTERELPSRRPTELRVLDWHEVYEAADDTVTRRQASRCMDCGVPFCHSGCPLGNLIPEWNDLVWRGMWQQAIERLHATNNFPEFTGRLCPAPCESACVLGINQPAVTIKQTEVSVIDHAWDNGWVTPQTPAWLSNKTVAVIGSGPAGLAAAQQLTRAGHTVAVYESAQEPGGLLRYGIPEFKLEKRHLDRRIEQMRAEGTRFRTGITVGRDITGTQVRERYDAVVLAVGSTVARELPVPGREAAGILQAMDYLPQANRFARTGTEPSVVATGKDVVIIGGGDTGADCLGTALRQGARSVVQLEIMPRPPQERSVRDPWPTYPMIYRVSSAHEEGGERVYAVSTTGFDVDNSGTVTGLRVRDVQLIDGKPTADASTERVLPAQLVLLAMGFTGPETQGLLTELAVDIDARGTVVRDTRFSTTQPGIFVAGDAGRGQSLIVWAIAEGRACAAAVDRYLSGGTLLPEPISPTDRPVTAW